MNIYIDESGIFANPNSRSKALSCVGALVIPTCSIDKVLSKFADLRNGWLGSTAEIKGSKLNEEQVASVVELSSSSCRRCCNILAARRKITTRIQKKREREREKGEKTDRKRERRIGKERNKKRERKNERETYPSPAACRPAGRCCPARHPDRRRR